MQIESEIITIGNEILIGKIADTNSKWIIDQLTPLGIKITRITSIPDKVDIIGSTIKNSLKERSPDYIFITGGLGPTFDDMTLKGVSLGINSELKYNEGAMDLIKGYFRLRYHGKEPEKSKFFKDRYSLITKMATIPKGSTALFNNQGTAPGVFIPEEKTNKKTKIYCMPGIPIEMKSIFNDHIKSEVVSKTNGYNNFHECGFVFHSLGESRFTELIYEIKDEYPDIWIKTHPSRKDLDGKIRYEVELHLTTFSKKPSIIQRLDKLYTILKDYVLKCNGIITKENRI